MLTLAITGASPTNTTLIWSNPSTSGFPRAHLWYRVGKPRNQNQFSFLDCSGQIISSNHVAFPNPETNLVALYQAFLDIRNPSYILPPIPPYTPHGGEIRDMGIGASLPLPLPPPLLAECAADGTLEGVEEGNRHCALLRALVAWVRTHHNLTPSAIQNQALFLRDTLDDVRDFTSDEVLAIAQWVSRKLDAGDIRLTWTPEQRSRGGKNKARDIRQKNFKRDKRILALHNGGFSNRAIAAKITNISESQVRNIINRDG